MTENERNQGIVKLLGEIQATERDLILLERTAKEYGEAYQTLGVFMRHAADRAADLTVKPENVPVSSDFLCKAAVEKAIALAKEIEKMRAQLNVLQAQKKQAHLD